MHLLYHFLIFIFSLYQQVTPTEPVITQVGFYERLADSASQLIYQKVHYDPSYFQLDYPNGDLPPGKGVCTDVIIRAYRKLGIDLQQKVHEDMRAHFHQYPKKWGLTKPDKNIDHRRVPNLMTFFSRHGTIKNITMNASDYLPGDIVCWQLPGGLTHIGILVNQQTPVARRHLVVHNIGAGQVMEDCLFRYNIIGHYRYGK